MKTQKTKSFKGLKMLLTALICFTLNFSSAFSQTVTPGWHFVNPSPAPYNNYQNIYSTYFFNNNTGYIAGERGLVHRTTDGGKVWHKIPMPVTSTLYKIIFTDNSTGYIFGNNGNILKTVNGGYNWTLLTSGTTQTIRNAYFVAPNIIYAVGGSAGANSLILKSTNDGASWSTQTSPASQNLNSVHFINANTGIASGNNGTIVRTTNGGANWTLRASGTTVNLNGVAFRDNAYGFAVGESSTLLFSTDAGLNWGIQTGVSGSFKIIKFKDATEGYLGGPGGQYRTINGGGTWIQINMTLYPNDISFPVSGNNYYCAGNLSNRGIAYSSNGGANWTPIDRIELGGVNLNELQFTSVNSGFALGSNTYLYNTTNGGFNWNYAGIASVNSFTINGSRGCAVGNNGYIGLSSNGGNSWTGQTFGTINYYGVSFSSSVNGIIVGNAGSVLVTTNGGANWNVRTSGTTQTLRKVKMLSDQIAIAIGDNGTAIKSTDGGNEWFDLTTGTSFNLKDIHFTDGNTGFVSGNGGTLIKTTNAGSTWTTVSTGVSNSLNSIDFRNSTGMIVGNSGTILISTNSGTSWLLQNGITEINLNGVSMPSDNIWYITGDSATVLRTTTSGNLTGINYSNFFNIPDKFTLSQNYPNPFNPATKIKFDIKEPGLVKLTVYDLLGRAVATLLNENLTAGSYEKGFDGSKLTSGVYFYKLEAGDYTEVRKMTLVK